MRVVKSETRFDQGGARGILADIGGLEMWIHVALVALAAASTGRYIYGHGLGWRTGWIVLGVAALLAVYGVSNRRSASAGGISASVWALVIVGVWVVLVLNAPSFSWLAVPLSFVALRVLAFPVAAGVLLVMTAVVVVAWTGMQGVLDPTIVVGPTAIAALALVTYRALDRESTARLVLVEELKETQIELAETQHQAGVAAERARLSRDIHDSIAQALTSINLLLEAAEQDWDTQPGSARSSVGQAAITARDGLRDVRTVVRDLAPSGLGTDRAAALPEALRLLCERESINSQCTTDVRVFGDPRPLPPDIGGALLRSTRGLLANAREHGSASAVTISLTYQPDSVSVDVRDDGAGFDPDGVTSEARGFGLSGIQARVQQFGGSFEVESSPARGTSAVVSIPIETGT